MSWSFDFVAEDSEAVAAAIARETHVPPDFSKAIIAAVEKVTPPAGHILHIVSSGHLGEYGGNADLKIGYTRIARAPAVEQHPPSLPEING